MKLYLNNHENRASSSCNFSGQPDLKLTKFHNYLVVVIEVKFRQEMLLESSQESTLADHFNRQRRISSQAGGTT